MPTMRILAIRCWFVALLAAAPLLALAQSDGERVALVIGNSNYKTSTPLPNPGNDARAMAELLRRAGFGVEQRTDTNQAQLKEAIDKFGQVIRNPKVKFALFYYAGHGLQLDWRNYLVPITADIRTAEDVKKQTVDVSELLAYMEQAKGRSFMVILDACRDDPFAGSYRPPAKGLSQFDAPVGSLLAYATAPGQVAADGEGDNGLYTGHLVREFARPGEKVEDALKRVRLAVRVASKGRQVPWESTSLEEDVYIFPIIKKKLSENEQEQQLDQEIEAWVRVKSSNNVDQLASFLQKHPSGYVSELAQSRLSRLMTQQANAEMEQRAREQQVTAQQQLEAQRLARQKAEAERTAREEAARQAEAERRAREEAVRQAGAERRAREDAARLAEAERLARLEAQRSAEAERLAREDQARRQAEADRIAREEETRRQAETVRLAREAEERRQAEAGRLAREEEARRTAAAERKARAESLRQAEQAQLARESEARRLAQAETRAREEAERLARIAEQARQEAQRVAQAETASRERARAEAEAAERAREQAQREMEAARQQREAEQRRTADARRAADEEQRRMAEGDRLARELEARAQAETRRVADQEEVRRQAEAQRAQVEAQRRTEQDRVARDEAAARTASVERARMEASRAADAQRAAREEQVRRAAEAQAAERAGAEALRQAEAARLAREAELQRVAVLQQQAVQLQAAIPRPVPLLALASTPYSKGFVEHDRSYAVGDIHEFRVIDSLTRLERPLSLRVTTVDTDADRVEFNGGEYVSDLMGNMSKTLVGVMSTPRQLYPAELFVGKKWHTMFKQLRPNGEVNTFRYDLKVVGRESVTVPAGTFDTFKIEAHGYNIQQRATITRTIWVAPGVPADIAHETVVRLRTNKIEQFDRQELVSVKPGGTTATR